MQDHRHGDDGRRGILDMIEDLEDLLANDIKLPFVNRAFWVDVDEFFAQTERIRLALPKAIQSAERVVKDSERKISEAETQKERMIQEARKEGERLTAEARQNAERLTDQSEVTRTATARAREIIREAEDNARDIKKGADEYARGVLQNLDEHVARVISSIRQGRDKLEADR